MMTAERSTGVPAPLRIGDLVVDPPLILAPMAGVTDALFRQLMARHGAGMVTTEMVSAEGIRRGQPGSWRLCRQDVPLAVPLAVQVFGRDPRGMAEAAALMEAEGAAVIDINAGCPVPKVVRHGSGACLLREPDRLLAVVEAVRKAVAVPLTVKTRIGWDERSIGIVRLARRLAEAGVNALTLHARTAVQHYDGRADWRWIEAVKRESSIPIIGNGDVRSPAEADRMRLETGCDGVMIGRASMGNPWLLAAIAAHWGRPSQFGPHVGWSDFRRTAEEHLTAFLGRAGKPLGHLKKLVVWYSRGCPGAVRLRAEIMPEQDADGVLRRFGDWARGLDDGGEPFLKVKAIGDGDSSGCAGARDGT